jgi:hypothetical protein
MGKMEIGAGATMKVLEDGKEIDRVLILSIHRSGETVKVNVKSLSLYPGTEHLFGLFDQGWRLLFEGPMAGFERFFSHKAPFYVFEAT